MAKMKADIALVIVICLAILAKFLVPSATLGDIGSFIVNGAIAVGVLLGIVRVCTRKRK